MTTNTEKDDKSSRPCPCHSGNPYGSCCEPLHLRAVIAPSPERLMRSRYSAFALKLIPYLYETMHGECDDRKRVRAEVMRGLRDASDSFRYLGLKIIEAQIDPNDQLGWVLFHARLFERGTDRSFVELSEFRREGGEWRCVLSFDRRGYGGSGFERKYQARCR